jgi:hypothetical protein
MAYYNQGIFQPKAPQKYVGTLPITYRSSWELTFMNTCDQHPNVLQWASESIKIPYLSPMDGRWHNYIPDFLIVYVDKAGKKHGELIEIKPLSQSVLEKAKSKKDKAALILNQAKWQAAQDFCRKQGLTFRVMTEQQLYRQTPGK